ncbi:HAMP domain-containing sensor histidine kinase [Pseudoclostridium thermosuccinogenes]|uniref:sensor histidine kinase n=1 Tax=Clostridium thermosuccinogenes TaxID=84032 RepID=UPI002FDA44DA
MDTKLKKSKPFLIWLCFFIGMNIVISAIMLGIMSLDEINNNFDVIRAVLKQDLKSSQNFINLIADRFDFLARYINDDADRYNASGEYLDRLENEGENLIYYAINPKTEKILTNSKTDHGISEKGKPSLPKGYDYFLYFDGERFIAEQGGKTIDVYRKDSGYKKSTLWRYINGNPSSSTVNAGELTLKHQAGLIDSPFADIPDIKGCRILLMVKKNIIENPYAYSSLYNLKRSFETALVIIAAALIIFLAGVALLVFSIIKRNVKREFDKVLVRKSGAVWFEVKAVISLFIINIPLQVLMYGWYFNKELVHVLILICFWWFYLMFKDLYANRRSFLSNNSISALIKFYRSFESRKPFQKAMLLRIYALIAAEAVLVILVAIFFYGFLAEGGIYLLPALVFFAMGVYLAYRYLKRYSNEIGDMGRVLDHIEAIKNGDMETKLALDPGADLYTAAENLNKIQEGISKAVEEKIRSERMKVELITNVSHDLKTPLTSIISYADLLSKEEGLPDHVMDYIKILVQKSDRLKTLIQDIFELSKATSGDLKVEKERIDLGKLIRQTLADLDERISQSGLLFKIDIPDEPVYIISDGKKLYRVFLNLIGNALKYSLEGSRVYITLEVKDGKKAMAVIKNIANYEMDFKEEEVLERFVRGDKSRTTEGSGLGLAIARSFVQACGGSMNIKVDGDLFKVELGFNIE